MSNFWKTTIESRAAWEANADYWDERMGESSNDFHRNIVRPHTEKLLNVRPGELVLDVACGNGNYSKRLSKAGAEVVAFDYSEKMICHAKRRCQAYLNNIRFHVCDATNFNELMALKQERLFDKAVSNMAVMDIANIEPIFKAVHDLLKPGGIFVFSTHHPCFVRPDSIYLSSKVHKGEAIRGQPVMQYYYHRSLQDLFGLFFKCGFVIDGFFEEPDDDDEYPIIVIVRLRKHDEFLNR